MHRPPRESWRDFGKGLTIHLRATNGNFLRIGSLNEISFELSLLLNCRHWHAINKHVSLVSHFHKTVLVTSSCFKINTLWRLSWQKQKLGWMTINLYTDKEGIKRTSHRGTKIHEKYMNQHIYKACLKIGIIEKLVIDISKIQKSSINCPRLTKSKWLNWYETLFPLKLCFECLDLISLSVRVSEQVFSNGYLGKYTY